MDIRVNNTFDDAGPPTSFKWVENYIIADDVPFIDLDFTPNCVCEIECSIMKDSLCDCMKDLDFGLRY
jgi:hypothetical protein